MNGFKRLIFFQNGLQERSGHFLPETRLWREAVLGAGMAWHGFSSTRLDPRIAAEIGVDPSVPILPGQKKTDLSQLSCLAAFLEFPDILCSILQQKFPGTPSASDLLFVPYATEVEMMGVAKLLSGVAMENRPAVAFMFHHPAHEWETDSSTMTIRGDFTRFQYAAGLLKMISPNVRYYGVIPILSQELSRILGSPVGTLPWASQLPHQGYQRCNAPRWDVAIPGSGRVEQGFGLWPQIHSVLRRIRPESKMLFQVSGKNQEKLFRAAVIQEENTHNTSIAHATPDRISHISLLDSCRLILLPYLPSIYALRGSGIFTEVCSLGKPVVAHSQTPMGRMIRAGLAAGITFQEHTASSIANAVDEALSRIEQLERRAQELSPVWRDRHDVTNILRNLTADFANQPA